jgi:glutathione synthase/RimK-type ligase-like ATP-grasp enzyme
MKETLFVIDDDQLREQLGFNAISFEAYLRDYPKFNEPKIRVINLCDTDRYLSQGYYCSLLAAARGHEVLPSIKVINALRTNTSNIWIDAKGLGFDLSDIQSNPVQVVCMGEVEDQRYRKIADRAFQDNPSPILELHFSTETSGLTISIKSSDLSQLTEEVRAFCLKVLEEYSRKHWRKRGADKKYRWEMAMLANPMEAVPPSNRAALSQFIKAGEKLGIRLQPLPAEELRVLNQYDGLFIRETTAIDHHTYRLACQAEQLGLVVIDDPESILRCCNKVFLHDAFNYRKVPSLRTQFISDAQPETLTKLEESFSFPIVLKMPEGSFSKGVFKVNNADELKQVANNLLKDSALVLAQEYLYTTYDWRIGVLNGRTLYACRYFMARNHWQIYNHGSKRHFTGGFDAMPTFEVPRHVLEAALKAAAVVGNGLYGIDIKEVDGRAYVLEVNDNPSIETGVEDKYLGKELYMQIMSEFSRRLELRGR